MYLLIVCHYVNIVADLYPNEDETFLHLFYYWNKTFREDRADLVEYFFFIIDLPNKGQK